MSSAQRHVIRRQVVDVAFTGSEADGLALQREVSDLTRDWLAPALDETFSRAQPNGEHWFLERLDVDIGVFTVDSFRRDFVSAVAASIEGRLASMAKPGAALAASREQSAPGRGGDMSGETPGAIHSGREIHRLTQAQSVQEALVHFLMTGTLPWWFRLPATQTFEQAVIESTPEPASISRAVMKAIASPVARQRLIRQFSADFLELVLHGISPTAAEAIRQMTVVVVQQRLAMEMQRRALEHIWQLAFTAVASQRAINVRSLAEEWLRDGSADHNAAERAVMIRLAQIWLEVASSTPPAVKGSSSVNSSSQGHGASEDTNAVRDAVHGQTSNDSAVPARASGSGRSPLPARNSDDAFIRLDLDDGIFVDCAGLVLLHPFLSTLFERLDIAADGKLVAIDRALALLHFLASGAKSAPEYALALPKILCGFALDEPAGAAVEVTPAEEAEANALLVAVIGHWGALGDTSPDALRGTFLMRPGKLATRGDDYLLQVEPQSVDVLLDRLPWSIGAVRLPWMTRLLWVEWRL